MLFVTTTAVTRGDTTGIITTASFFLRADQGFMRCPFMQLRINNLDDEAAPC
jgi:hypothetical protein